jgi:carbon-monoxide dehydrogenase large subunit
VNFSRLVALGLYDIECVSVRTTAVVTNAAPTGSYRGAGRPEAAYAIERAVDAFARTAGLDPVEVRRANFIPTGALPHRTPTGALYDSGDYAEALRRAVDLVQLGRLREEQQERLAEGRNPIGVGFGAFVERAGGAVDAGEYGRVEIDRAGSIIVRTGSASSGQGHETAWAQLAAEALAVSPNDIRYVAGDTDEVAQGTGTFASRSAQIGGAAIWRTAHVVRRKAIELVAELLESAPADVRLTEGTFSVVGVPGTEMGWSDVAKAAYEQGVELAAEEWFVPGAQTFPYGVHVAVVEVDLDTGEVRLDRIVAVDDCGNVLNPMIVDGQLHGSLMQGIGQALYEGIQYSQQGQLLTSTLIDYAMPRATDAPPVISERLVHPAPSNPLGVKGTGEAGCIGAPPAIVNAVLDALAPYGVRDIQMPLRPVTVWTALEQSKDRMARSLA